MDRRLEILPTRSDVENRVAAALIGAVANALESRGRADIVVTGGTVGIGSLAAVRSAKGVGDIDWSRVHVWWGDERFVPAGHPDRNEGQARAALFDHIDIPPTNLHMFPSDNGQTLDVARDTFAALIDSVDPYFDVVLNGIGPDGHVASLFPGFNHGTGELVIAVRESPKPPPERLSMTFELLNRGRQMWIVASGSDKANAIRGLLANEDVSVIPATGLRGTNETVVWLDADAASRLTV